MPQRQRLQAFYAAADRLDKDKEFHAKTEKILGGYPLLRGDRLEKTIQQAFQIDAETQRFVKEWVGQEISGEVRLARMIRQPEWMME